MKRRERIGQAHVGQLFHGSGRERIAAGLVARKRASLNNDDIVALRCEPVGRGSTGGAATYDEHVVTVVSSHRCSLPGEKARQVSADVRRLQP
jgi:hypothetical protein